MKAFTIDSVRNFIPTATERSTVFAQFNKQYLQNYGLLSHLY